MGKDQKKKRAARRHNPIRVPDSHLPKGLAAAASTSTKQDKILPIIQKLESLDAADRTWACAAVSNLINNDPSTRRLLQGNNIVGILIQKLSDSVDEVVVEASGALRNLAIDGGYEICGEMSNKHILDSLKTFVPKISSAFTSYFANPSPLVDDSLSLIFQLAENAITLFWCLSETSNKTLNAVNNVGLVPFLMALIESRSKFPVKLVLAAAQCLYVLTDDNTVAIEILHTHPTHPQSLLEIAQSTPDSFSFLSKTPASMEQINSLRVLCCGILKNISPFPSHSSLAEVDLDRTVILPLFVPLLGTDLGQISARVYTIASQPVQKTPQELKHTPGSDHKTAEDLELEKIETGLLTIQLCLEILTGLCANLPDYWEASKDKGDEDGGDSDEEDDDEDDGEKMEEDEAVEPMEDDDDDDDEPTSISKSKSNTKAAHKSASPSDVEPELVTPAPDSPNALAGTPTALLHLLTTPLVSLARPNQLSFPPASLPSIHPPTTSVLGGIHIRALECLNNLFVGIGGGEDTSTAVKAGSSPAQIDEEMVKGAISVWEQMWSADLLGAVGQPQTESTPGSDQEKRMEMWNIASGVLWGLARMAKGTLVPNAEQVKILMDLCDRSTEEKVKVQCIGTLGCLAQYQGAIDSNFVIANYLLRVLTSTTFASPAAAAAAGSTGSQASAGGAGGYTIEVALQAASSLIDIYADENSDYDANFRAAKVLKGMSDSVKGAKKLVKSAIDLRKPGGRALRAWADGVVGDIVGFIDYRRKLGR